MNFISSISSPNARLAWAELYCCLSRYLEFVVSFTRRVSRVVCIYFPLFVGEGVPDAHSFPIHVPGTFSLVGRAASSPGETFTGGHSRTQNQGCYLSLELDILTLMDHPTSWEGAIVEWRPLVLGPVKVLAGWDTHHQNEKVKRSQGAPLQHHGLQSSVTPKRDEQARLSSSVHRNHLTACPSSPWWRTAKVQKITHRMSSGFQQKHQFVGIKKINPFTVSWTRRKSGVSFEPAVRNTDTKCYHRQEVG